MDDLNTVVNIIKQGGVVILPTDTAFALSCRMDSKEAVERLFKIKKRPAVQPVPVFVDSISMAEKYLNSPLPNIVRQNMKEYWPGALTIVYYCRKNLVPELVRGSGDTLGVRMPEHKICRSVIRRVGIPVLGSSANIHNQKTVFKFENLSKKLINLVDFVLYGEGAFSNVSTVVDFTKNPYQVIRPGAIFL